MIKKIKRIKNLGLVFSDYTWDPGLLDFEKFNLIYGWNGTGKTTFSKIFEACERGNLLDYESLEYEIEDESGRKYENGEIFSAKIRVFNQDYVYNNLKIRDAKAKSITLLLGDANKEIIEQIDNDTLQLEDKEKKLKNFIDNREQKNKAKNKTFTEIAKTIYVAITGGPIRTYRKDSAESDFSTILQKELLPDAEMDSLIATVKQVVMPPIGAVSPLEIRISDKDIQSFSYFWDDLMQKTTLLMLKTVESEIIQRLKDNPKIAKWVEDGMLLHEEFQSEYCEFCWQALPKPRLLELSEHFSETDRKLKQEVDGLISNCNLILKSINDVKYPDKARFYDEFQADYENICGEHEKAKALLVAELERTERVLHDKKTKTTESVNFKSPIKASDFIQFHEKIIAFVDKHNRKTTNFNREKDIAIDRLKLHYLSTIFDEVKTYENEINGLNNAIARLENGDPVNFNGLGIIALKKRIFDNQTKISSTHKACDEINKGLATFLGRDELIFVPNKTKVDDGAGNIKEIDEGYNIMRSGKPAIYLSEGEKTAIALVYFIIHLRDREFTSSNGIIVIDDPVCSFDSNSIFQAFAILKNSIKDAKQIFILTHDFHFLKLLLNWCRRIPKRDGKKNYFMIKNRYENGARCAYLSMMDKELCEFESEYHYLFKILKEFESDDTIAQAYPIPNIARKVLDTFLLFRIPSGDNPYDKLEKIKETTGFDQDKIAAIYKFTNEQSHITGSGFDPALVPETQKVVKYLLELIAAVAPEHYGILVESVG